jgi:hypothetical protein
MRHSSPVMVHLQDAPLAHGTVMCSIWLDAAALRTLKDNLALAKAHLLNVLLRRVAERHGARIGEHCLEVTGDRQERDAIEQDNVDELVVWIGTGQQHDFHDDKLRVSDKKPCQHSAYYAADILKEADR